MTMREYKPFPGDTIEKACAELLAVAPAFMIFNDIRLDAYSDGTTVGSLLETYNGRYRNSKKDSVNHPPHYTSHPSGIECIDVVEHFGFCIGNAIKYCWRTGLKGDPLEDLKKARWYIDREIQRLEKAK